MKKYIYIYKKPFLSVKLELTTNVFALRLLINRKKILYAFF